MRVLVWGVPAAFVVAGATLAQWSWRPYLSRPAVLLGNASYALYLFHLPLIMIFAALGYGRSSWPIVIATCIVASISIHFLIERPILGWFRSKPPERSPGMSLDVSMAPSYAGLVRSRAHQETLSAILRMERAVQFRYRNLFPNFRLEAAPLAQLRFG